MSIASIVPQKLRDRREAAAYLGVNPQTLALWASTGRYSLPFIKIGRSVRYRQEDLDAFIASRTVMNTGEASEL